MKKLLCRVGWHDWAERAADDGKRFRECRRCSAVQTDDLPPDFMSNAIG